MDLLIGPLWRNPVPMRMPDWKHRIWRQIAVACVLLAMNEGLYAHGPQENKRARVLRTQNLPPANGGQLKATLVEVNYGPGESSPPHSHPCPVMVYVVSGAIRTRVQGGPEMVVKAGGTFYEDPNGVHLISSNASSTEPARMVAWFLCDHDGPLSTDKPQQER